MFDFVPVEAWWLLLIAITAAAPLIYLIQHVRHDPARREVGLPPQDVEWRSSRRFWLSLLAVFGLTAIAILIFTPIPERVSKSDWLMPAIMAGLAIFAGFTVIKGVSTGKVELLVRGFNQSYYLATQPKRFWLTMAWNSALTLLFALMPVATMYSSREERCRNDADKYAQEEALVACDAEIAARDAGDPALPELFFKRGYANDLLHRQGAALRDYTRAIDADPFDSYALYNRALIRQARADHRGALSDFNRSLAVRDQNADGYRNRARSLFALGRYGEAKRDISRVLVSEPDDSEARSAAKMLALPQSDLDRVRAKMEIASTPAWEEARAMLKGGDETGAARRIGTAIKRAPDDEQVLRLLIDLYFELGEPRKADVVNERLANRRYAAGE